MIIINDLCKQYNNKYLYKNFNITFQQRQITGILGPSGCGKTTLLRMVAGLESYEKGIISGMENEKVAIIFQEDRLIPWLSVYDNIKFVLKSYMETKEMEEKIQEILKLLRLWEYKDYLPNELSGGMQRRVAMGRAFVYESTCILMDEPFKGLDYALKDKLIEDLKELWQAYPKTILFVTHDYEEAKKMAHVIYTLEGSPVTYKAIKE